MRTTKFFASLAIMFAATAGRSAPRPRPQQNPPAAQQPPASDRTLKTQTRLITVDVVVTDSHGNAVRGLKQEDFQVFEEHGRQQKIAQFRFVDTKEVAAAAPGNGQPASASRVYANVESAPMKVAPTVILMDALNTNTFRQIEVRRDMIVFLKTLPADTPVAVFLLGHTVHMVQGFTTNPDLLRAAVDKAHSPTMNDRNPQDDANSASNVAQDWNSHMPAAVIKRLEDFEKEQYMEQIQQRVEETADAMKAIAKYLGGYPGRKNLIWFSESFPIWISPSADFGSNPFAGFNSFAGKVREAAEALTEARVAVYPVDARALEASQALSASSETHMNRQNPGAGFAGALSREDSERFDSQATMEEVADETGGRTCQNTNDLAGCVHQALEESSSYYELAYYPEDVPWDGRFHKVTVKAGPHGIKLAYRRGYFATDAQEPVKHDEPLKLLQQACSDPLPSTEISLTAQPIPPAVAQGQPTGARYLLTISPSKLSQPPAGAPRELHLQMAICEFNAKEDAFQLYPRDLSGTVSEAVYQSWQAHGIRNIFDFNAKPENQRLRFAVLDLQTGDTGALDVPAHPHEFGALPGSAVAVPAALADGAAPPRQSPVAGSPASAAAPGGTSQRKITTSLIFRSNLGTVGTLDWNTGQVSYHGDLAVEVGAFAFFQKLLGAQYHCQGGNLVSNDPNSNAVPKLAFVFPSPAGPIATVDMTGSEPQYSGDLPVAPDAKVFFDEVWKVCHCQRP